VWSSEGEFSDQELRDNLREQGIAATDPLREVQRDIGRVRKEHRAPVYDFAVNYLRVASPSPRAELRRLGYLTTTVDAAFPGDLKTQRIRLEDTLRFAYDGLLSDAQVREIYAQPGLTATPAFNAAVERLHRPPEEAPKPSRRPKRRPPEPPESGPEQSPRLRARRDREWVFTVRSGQVVVGLAGIIVLIAVVIVVLLLHLG